MVSQGLDTAIFGTIAFYGVVPLNSTITAPVS
ncbi:hypothetical protein M1N08_01400 [Dehalococcoidia bacterium]|nr:hypothetical protein [Dehalococcoidia bacterium]